MSRTKKIIASFVAVLLICSLLTASVIYTRNRQGAEMSVDDEVYEDAENTLMGFLGMEDEKTPLESTPEGIGTEDAGLNDNARMTQRVTIVSDAGVLPISGTVSKVQDAFYPGTYEVKFSNKAILTGLATIRVSLNVDQGETVYILTGTRETGYTQYDVVTAGVDNVVSFDTSVLQDYTISTTDIIGAQEAMASLMK
ncbi:MAG: hypothetical protein K6F75_11405 [Butyrivibrio sp.]|nr:hypothetical protein [Butyrivibrio sp.]